MKFLYLLIIFCLYINIATAADTPDSIKADWAIKTPKEAVARALLYTGFDKCKSYVEKPAEEIAELIIAVDSTTPFLHDKINHQKAWSIDFARITIEHPNQHAKSSNRWTKDFNVLLDAATGNLFKITGSIRGDTTFPEPQAQIAENQMQDKYHAFIDGFVGKSFFEIIEIDKHVRAAIANSANFGAVFVMYSSNLRDYKIPKPTWVITCKGLEPIVPSYSVRAKMDQRRTERIVVDPDTGEWVFTSTLPCHPNPPWDEN